MRTAKPISTIAYQSDIYLKNKLNELTKSGIIEFWTYINHMPEDDEGGKKEHKHLYIIPAKLLQTEDLRKSLIQINKKEPDKPFKCNIFRNTKKFGDWYLYAIHNKAYLMSKGQSRRYHYNSDQLVSSDQDVLNMLIKEIDLLEVSRYQEMIDAQRSGTTWTEYFKRGTVPIQQIHQFREAWFTLMDDKTLRNGKENHERDTELELKNEAIKKLDALIRKHYTLKQIEDLINLYNS